MSQPEVIAEVKKTRMVEALTTGLKVLAYEPHLQPMRFISSENGTKSQVLLCCKDANSSSIALAYCKSKKVS